MACLIKLDSGEFMRSLGLKDHTKFWDAPLHDQQFGENESTDIGNSQESEKRAMLE
jgi:hypothetical protein